MTEAAASFQAALAAWSLLHTSVEPEKPKYDIGWGYNEVKLLKQCHIIRVLIGNLQSNISRAAVKRRRQITPLSWL